MKKINPILLTIITILILNSCSVIKKIDKNIDSNYRAKNNLPPKETPKIQIVKN